ncbi:response regulator [Candidatus Parcubacteria bacterium]|nr:response regulator [Candidatus Parcubacteria bacterium]
MSESNTKKVLIVEDDKDFSYLLEQSFNNQGMDMSYAHDGEEGLALAEKINPDLIMIDILMPKMDGIEMARQVRAKGISSKIIFLTNFKDLDHISQAIEVAGEADYIVKADMHLADIVKRAKDKLGVK